MFCLTYQISESVHFQLKTDKTILELLVVFFDKLFVVVKDVLPPVFFFDCHVFFSVIFLSINFVNIMHY